MQGQEGPLLYSPWANASPGQHLNPHTCEIGSCLVQLLPVRDPNYPGVISDAVSPRVSGLSGSSSMARKRLPIVEGNGVGEAETDSALKNRSPPGRRRYLLGTDTRSSAP